MKTVVLFFEKGKPTKKVWYLRATANQAAQPVISYKTIKPVIIPFPESLLEQTATVERFRDLKHETDRLYGLYEKKLNALDELKKTLLNKAFTGQLTTDPSEMELVG